MKDDLEKPRPKIEIPVLAAGSSSSTSSSSSEPKKFSKEITIQAIEAKLRALESKSDDFVINKTSSNEMPIIQKYQYNKNATENSSSISSNKNHTKYGSKSRYTNKPYNKRHKR